MSKLFHKRGQAARTVIVLAALLAVAAQNLPAGDNTEQIRDATLAPPWGDLFDKVWDRKFYDGQPNSAIPWHYDDGGRPEPDGSGGVTASDFLDAVQAAFDNWSSINDELLGDASVPQPLIPTAAFAGNVNIPVDPTDMMKLGTIDGINAFTWETGGQFFGQPGGVLAGTVSAVLLEEATTVDQNPPVPNASRLEIDTGVFIDLAVPAGTVLGVGSIIDADIGTDAADDWRFKADTSNPLSPGIDVESVETHEIGHFWGQSHTIVGIVGSASSPDDPTSSFDDATMVPSIDATTHLRTLRFEDKASAIRTYARNNGVAQNPAGLALVTGRVVRDPISTDPNPGGPDCSVPATGVSIRAVPISSSNLTSSPYDFEDMSFAMGPPGGGKPETKCTDGKDNDHDGATDCDDSDCDSDPACGGCPGGGPEDCSNTLDDDCDGDIDCADTDCAADPFCAAGCNNGLCEVGESCQTCVQDCPTEFCGNGICEPGEDCTGCSDCRGRQNGKPDNRYCCGAGGTGGGENPVDSADSRCTSGGVDCTESFCAPTCGDGNCDPGEDQCGCAADCGTPPTSETGLCSDGIDNDCDELTDSLDVDDCASPFTPDGADTFTDSEFRNESNPDGTFVLNIPAGSDYELQVLTRIFNLMFDIPTFQRP